MQKNIFIVEDNTIYSKMLAKVIIDEFKQENFKVFIFPSGEECLKSLHIKPNLVLIDFYLAPYGSNKMDGLDLIGIIQKKYPSTDFIMITSEEDTRLFLKSLNYNIYDFITKNRLVDYNLILTVTHWLKFNNTTKISK